ncbi:MAG: hypothetical protein ACRD6W_03355, partial [Nitrososphaerales archaeon]
ARGRARRHRRRLGLGAAGMAVAIGLAVGLTAGIGSDTVPSARMAAPVKLGSGPVHVQLMGFSVNSNSNGTVTVTVTPGQVMDPNVFRQILAQAGVPAMINVGSICRTPGQPPAPRNAISIHPQAGGTLVMVITPSLVPEGAEYSIGYFSDYVAFTLVTVGEPLSCGPNTSRPGPVANPGS